MKKVERKNKDDIFKDETEYVENGKIYKIKDTIEGMELLGYINNNFMIHLSIQELNYDIYNMEYYYFYEEKFNVFYKLRLRKYFNGIKFNWRKFKFEYFTFRKFEYFEEIAINDIIKNLFENGEKDLAKNLSKRFVENKK